MVFFDDLNYYPEIGYYSRFEWYYSPVFQLFDEEDLKRKKSKIFY